MSFFDDQMEEWELGGCQGDPTQITDFGNMAAEAERQEKRRAKRQAYRHRKALRKLTTKTGGV
jgi:hypothetical protein